MGMLDGKTALVTGAGRGIGRGIAIALASAGAKVVVNDLGASLSGEGKENAPAQTVVDEIVKYGGTAKANYGSVADFGQAAAMVQQVIDSWGRIDIVVHVAGILRDRMIFNMTEDEWDAVIDVHLKGMFNVVRAAAVSMREQKGGRIISMSSVSALGAPGQPNYAAAKAGIIGLTWSTANAMAKYGVTVNAIMPSGATRMIDSTPRGRAVFEQTGKWPSEQAVGTERDPDNVAPIVVSPSGDAPASSLASSCRRLAATSSARNAWNDHCCAATCAAVFAQSWSAGARTCSNSRRPGTFATCTSASPSAIVKTTRAFSIDGPQCPVIACRYQLTSGVWARPAPESNAVNSSNAKQRIMAVSPAASCRRQRPQYAAAAAAQRQRSVSTAADGRTTSSSPSPRPDRACAITVSGACWSRCIRRP